VTTPALGDLISVALPTITTPGGRLPRGGRGHGREPQRRRDRRHLWTKAGELLGITGCPDGGPALFIAAGQGAAAPATVFQDDDAYR
jgi:hypothetical protein